MTELKAFRGEFQAGERVQLTGPKGKLNTFTLKVGGVFGTHRGNVQHDSIIGKPDGSVVTNDSGIQYLALRPLLSDYVLSMPRGAAIIYPKDAANIIVQGDIFPGAVVVEAGVGSGGLSMYLLRAIGAEGKLISFERRADFAEIAKANVTAALGVMPTNWIVYEGSLETELPKQVSSKSVDRVVLDMLAPWECLESVAEALLPGGVLTCYVATVTQLSRVAEAIRDSAKFTEPLAFETLHRGWHLQGLAVRPEHRMSGHTGFLLTARRLADGVDLPSFVRRAKPEYSEEDISVWNPDNLGERKVSEKRVRKSLRKANGTAEARINSSSTEQ
ncbi:MAG: hypothetical protein RIQ88_907 [Actinomycetota bacterium]|jgi:tRNA (adenine57-N1/adenine58-N1)-methyltransferase